MRFPLLLSSLLVSSVLAAGGASTKPTVPSAEPARPDKPAPVRDGPVSKPPLATQTKFAADDTALLPIMLRQTGERKTEEHEHHHHHHHHHKHAKDDWALPDTHHNPMYDAPEELHHRHEKKIGLLYKRALKKSHVKLRRLKSVKNKINKGLAKLSGKEKKLHNYLAHKIKRSYKFVARQVSKAYMVFSIILEHILGPRIVFALDRIVGGAIIIGKGIGKFIIDHQAVIVGIAVGILVSLAVTGGLTMVTMNPLLAGAIGGAAGGVSSTIATHLWGAVVRGNLVPTSLEEGAQRTKRVAKEAVVSAAVGAVAGVISAGIGGAISGGHGAAASSGAHGAATHGAAGAHGAAHGAAHATTAGANIGAAHGAEAGLKLGAVNIGHPSHVVSHIVGDMGHHAVMKPVEKALEAETGAVAPTLAKTAQKVIAK